MMMNIQTDNQLNDTLHIAPEILSVCAPAFCLEAISNEETHVSFFGEYKTEVRANQEALWDGLEAVAEFTKGA